MSLRLSAYAWFGLLASGGLLLMAMNDGNNLLYLLAFFSPALLLVGAVQAGLALRRSQVQIVPPPASFAAEPRLWQLSVQAPNSALLTLQSKELGISFNINLNKSYSDIPNKRGARPWPELTLCAHDALGLLHWQRHIRLRGEEIVWPALHGDLPLPPGHRQHADTQADSPQDWRRWQDGDSLRRVQWRAFARHGQLLIAKHETPHSPCPLLQKPVGIALEAQLSQLATWIMQSPQHRLRLDDGAADSRERAISLERLARFTEVG